MSKRKEMDMTEGALLPKMLIFSIPLILSSILQLLFNAADLVVVSRYGCEDALGAVGSTGSLINLITNLFIGLSVGTNVLVARFFAAKEAENLKKTIHTSVLLSIILGIFLGILGILITPEILKLMGLKDNIWRLASLYLQIYFIGMPSVLLYNFGSAVLRAVGDTRRPLLYMIISGIVNLGLNLLLVLVFHLDVEGVAIATVISQTLSAILIVRTLTRYDGMLKLNLKELSIDKRILGKILVIGLPAGFQGTLFSLSNVFIQSSVNSFGDIVIKGNAAASNLEGFVYVAMNAYHQTALSFMSQNVGAGKKKRINKITLNSLILVTVVGLVLGNAVVIFEKPLLGIYAKDNLAIIEAGIIRLKYICSVYFLCGIMDVMVGALRGLGYSTMPMIVSLMGACVFRLIWLATIFKIDRFHTIETVYISYAISWILTFTVHLICYIIVKRKYDRAHA